MKQFVYERILRGIKYTVVLSTVALMISCSAPEARIITDTTYGDTETEYETSTAITTRSMISEEETSVKSDTDITTAKAATESKKPEATQNDTGNVNSNDLYWLSRIISAEAQGESYSGMLAVGSVILNRVDSNLFPDSIKEVIFDRKYGVQFSPVSSGTIYNNPTKTAIKAAEECLNGYRVKEILYFFNPDIATSTWIKRERQYAFTIGKHAFYK